MASSHIQLVIVLSSKNKKYRKLSHERNTEITTGQINGMSPSAVKAILTCPTHQLQMSALSGNLLHAGFPEWGNIIN